MADSHRAKAIEAAAKWMAWEDGGEANWHPTARKLYTPLAESLLAEVRPDERAAFMEELLSEEAVNAAVQSMLLHKGSVRDMLRAAFDSIEEQR